VPATFLYADADGYHFMDQGSYETLTLNADQTGEDRYLLVDNLEIQVHKYNGNPISLQFPALVEMTIASTEPAVRGDTSSGSVTKKAKTNTGLDVNVPLFIKEGERVKVHTETREFAGRA
jgi:elongation factor P